MNISTLPTFWQNLPFTFPLWLTMKFNCSQFSASHHITHYTLQSTLHITLNISHFAHHTTHKLHHLIYIMLETSGSFKSFLAAFQLLSEYILNTFWAIDGRFHVFLFNYFQKNLIYFFVTDHIFLRYYLCTFEVLSWYCLVLSLLFLSIKLGRHMIKKLIYMKWKVVQH